MMLAIEGWVQEGDVPPPTWSMKLKEFMVKMSKSSDLDSFLIGENFCTVHMNGVYSLRGGGNFQGVADVPLPPQK